MAKATKNSPSLIGRYKSLGLTFYKRGNTVCVRSSTAEQPRRQTSAQFINRQRMRQGIALWGCFGADDKPLMATPDGLGPYRAFLRLNAGLPIAYLTQQQIRQGACVLLPDICVSAGRLESLVYRFETIEGGRRLLVTNLATGIDGSVTQPLAATTAADLYRLLVGSRLNPQLRRGDVLRFYWLWQTMEEDLSMEVPRIGVRCASVVLDNDLRPLHFLPRHEFYTHQGRLAIGGADDEGSAYAVVQYDPVGKTASTQHIVTTYTGYRRYISPEAFARAVRTFSNVADPYLTPEAWRR
ncbi:MAG: hypothetical protein J5641_01145 [Bacteroidales bacterium]|nr:hypothetical protein [Bacteroidales bacterium]